MRQKEKSCVSQGACKLVSTPRPASEAWAAWQAGRMEHPSSWASALHHGQGAAQGYSFTLFVKQREIIKGAIKKFPLEPVLLCTLAWFINWFRFLVQFTLCLWWNNDLHGQGMWLPWAGVHPVRDGSSSQESPSPRIQGTQESRREEASVCDCTWCPPLPSIFSLFMFSPLYSLFASPPFP